MFRPVHLAWSTESVDQYVGHLVNPISSVFHFVALLDASVLKGNLKMKDNVSQSVPVSDE